jgi:uncharacterized protein (TIGR03437 family)
VSYGPNGSLHLTRAGIEFAAKGQPLVRLALSGAQAADPEGDDLQVSVSHYYLGRDSAKWRTGVANYGQVRYRGVYPGIDLIFHGSQRSFEYDFEVAPGADPRQIRLRFDGVKKLHLNTAGDLLTGDGGLTQHRPRIFQAGREIAGSYRIHRSRTVSFDIAPYDRTLALTIDPVITYVSYLGGNGADAAYGITIDLSGNVYLTGYTLAADFPGGAAFGRRPFQRQFGFVSKFAPVVGGKTQLLFTLFLGDQGSNLPTQASAVATDSAGNLIVAGGTWVSGFPTLNAFQPQLGGGLECVDPDGNAASCEDGFLAKFSPNGATLIFSTFYGAKYNNYFNDVAVDSAGGIYAVGGQEYGELTDLKGTPNSFQPAAAGGVDMVLTRWSPTGQLSYASFLGGKASEIANSVAVEKPGVVWVGGDTSSADMPFPAVNNGLQTKYTAYAKSAYLARLDMNQSGSAALTYASYFNGTINNTSLSKLFLDPTGQVGFCGATVSDIPVTATRMQVFGGVPASRVGSAAFVAGDGYVARINPSVAGTAGLTYSTYVGGSDSDAATSCGLDPKGNLVVSGWTYSVDQFLVIGSPIPYKLSYGTGGASIFLIRIDPTTLGGRVDSFLFGGTGDDVPLAMAISSQGFAYLTGQTHSTQFPVTQYAVQGTYGGDNGAFLNGACCGDAFLLQADLNVLQPAVAGLIQASGDFQFGAPGSTLPAPVAVRMADAGGNPLILAGYPISFTATNATLSNAQALTDGTGVAGTNVQLTGASDATVVATISGGAFTPYTFHLKALAGTLPKSAAIVSGDKQAGKAGAALPQPLVVELRDASNAPLPLAGLTVQFMATNASVSAVRVVTDATGRASTSVTLGTAAGAASVQAIVGSLAVVTAAYTVAGGGPVMNAGGLTSAATYLAGGVSPGLIVTLFGAGIGPAALAVAAPGADGKFPTTLAGTQVLFDGIAAPMVYASAGQSSAIVPYEVAAKASTQVTVAYQNALSPAQTLTVVPAQLGLFSANASGQGPGAILNQDNSVNSASNPAKRGSIVVLFGTGEGQTTPAGVDGQTAVSVYPKPITPITVKIGGSTGQVLYYGAAPTLVAGVLQINVTIPAGIPDGNATVQIFEGASQSPATITIAVKGDQ